MTDKELRRMSRADLIEIIAQYQSREQALETQIGALEAQAADRRTRLAQAGSIAEAALSLHGVFEAAQAAADQYAEEVRAQSDALRTEAERTLAAAQTEAEGIRAEAQRDYDAKLAEAARNCDAMYAKITELLNNYEELRSLLHK